MGEKGQSKNRLAIGVLLMLVCTACLCGGQLVWKIYDGFLPLIAGFAIYGIGSLAMISAYHFGEVSTLQPINSINCVLSAILGSVLFQEAITLKKIVGIALVMLGVAVLARGAKAK